MVARLRNQPRWNDVTSAAALGLASMAATRSRTLRLRHRADERRQCEQRQYQQRGRSERELVHGNLTSPRAPGVGIIPNVAAGGQ